MRKFQQLQQQTLFLPTIVQCPSRKDLKNPLPNTAKENFQPNRDRFSKIGLQKYQFWLPKKSQSKDYAVHLEQLLQNKLIQCEKTDLLTKPKLSKPWVAKQVDINKETTKNNRLHFATSKEKNGNVPRRKSCQNDKQRQDSQAYGQKTLNNSKPNQAEGSKMLKTTTKRAISVTRQKIYSCRLALKNCVFPMDQKKYQQARLADIFQKDQNLSIINKKEESDQQDQFITYESLAKMEL